MVSCCYQPVEHLEETLGQDSETATVSKWESAGESK